MRVHFFIEVSSLLVDCCFSHLPQLLTCPLFRFDVITFAQPWRPGKTIEDKSQPAKATLSSRHPRVVYCSHQLFSLGAPGLQTLESSALWQSLPSACKEIVVASISPLPHQLTGAPAASRHQVISTSRRTSASLRTVEARSK